MGDSVGVPPTCGGEPVGRRASGADTHLMPTPTAGRLQLNRRTFVGASIAFGGPVAAEPLVTGCGSQGNNEQGGPAVLHLRINGAQHEVTVDNRTSLLDMLAVERALNGRAPSAALSRAAAEHAADGAKAPSGNRFKVQLVRRTVERELATVAGST